MTQAIKELVDDELIDDSVAKSYGTETTPLHQVLPQLWLGCCDYFFSNMFYQGHSTIRSWIRFRIQTKLDRDIGAMFSPVQVRQGFELISPNNPTHRFSN